MCSSQVPSRSASVIEPEPEIQLESELSSLGPAGDELISMVRHAVPLKLSEIQPSAEMVRRSSVKIDVEQEDVQEIANRFQRFCQESDQQEKEEKVNHGDRIFEELQGKWRDMRGGMDVTDLRPEFRALLAPLNVRVSLSCHDDAFAKATRLPKFQESSLLTPKASEIAADRSRASPRKRLLNEAAVPTSPGTAGAVVPLPSLQSTGRSRPTSDRL